eukprot:443753-Pleurochrysis_carterae.AAC.1
MAKLVLLQSLRRARHSRPRALAAAAAALACGVGDGDGLVDLVLHLRDNKHLYRLPVSDAAHAKRALRVVTERHVLTQGERGAGGQRRGDVHPGRVHLVVKRKPVRQAQPTLLELDHLEPISHQDHLGAGRVEKDTTMHVIEPRFEQEPRDLVVAQAGHERARVYKRVQRRLPRGHRPQEAVRAPVGGEAAAAHHEGTR